MRIRKIGNTMFPLIALLAVCNLGQPSWSGDTAFGGFEKLDYYLAVTPPMPVPGQQVIVSLSGKSGRPNVGPIRWTLAGSGASFSNAGAAGRDGEQYAFTPNGPGTYTIQAEFQDQQGTYVATSLQLVLGDEVVMEETAPQTAYPQGTQQPVPLPQSMLPRDAAAPGTAFGDVGGPAGITNMVFDVNPPQPRAGQLVTFTFMFNGTVPNGSAVRWEISGGETANLAVSGRMKEVCAFVPVSQGAYIVKAEMYCPRGNFLGQITQGFVAVP